MKHKHQVEDTTTSKDQIPTFDLEFGGDEGDRAQYHDQLREFLRTQESREAPKPTPDDAEMPMIIVQYPNNEETCICFISRTKSYLPIGEKNGMNVYQLSTGCELAKSILSNPNLKPGDTLYKGAKALSVGFGTIKALMETE